MTTKTAPFDRVHNAWELICFDAIRQWKRPITGSRLDPILKGSLVIAWDNLGSTKGFDNVAACQLSQALFNYANNLERSHCQITAADCRWLAHLFSQQQLTVIDRRWLEG